MGSFFTTIAPGALLLAYSEASTTGNVFSAGIGRKEPYKASDRSPDSVQTGSSTLTRKTLRDLVSRKKKQDYSENTGVNVRDLVRVPFGEDPMDLINMNECLNHVLSPC